MFLVCTGKDSKNDLEISLRGGGWDGLTVGDGGGGLHNHLPDRVFTVGGAYKALEFDAKHAIVMGTRLNLKMHKRWSGGLGGHPNYGTS